MHFISYKFTLFTSVCSVASMTHQDIVTTSELWLLWAELTLTRILEKELVVLHLKVSWRS